MIGLVRTKRAENDWSTASVRGTRSLLLGFKGYQFVIRYQRKEFVERGNGRDTWLVCEEWGFGVDSERSVRLPHELKVIDVVTYHPG
jgi:hypothetical protein